MDGDARYSLRRTSGRAKRLEAENSNAGGNSAGKREASKMGVVEKKKRKTEKLQLNGNAQQVPEVVEKSAYAKVKETLRTFNKYFLQLSQKEDTSKDSSRNRPDLKASTEMRRTKAILYPEKRLGSLPGIDVGHQFFSRAEMVVVGFHQHWLNGIDFIGTSWRSGKALGVKQYELPVAVSIVLSGQYEDDLDHSEDIVYTGQGGNNLLGNKRQISDQVLERGNLALKNSMNQSLPVRVVRGHKCKNSYVGKVYTYDGLYRVVKYWAEKGVSGFTIFKFRLKRLEGQPPLTTKEVCFTRGCIPQSISEIKGLVCEDITGGLEDIPIPVTNLVDDPPISPTGMNGMKEKAGNGMKIPPSIHVHIIGFVYIKNMKFSKNTSIPKIALAGCNCQDTCTDPRSCGCAKVNGGDFPYVHNNGGRLVEPRAIVFECGPNCGCGPKCVNRTSQNGIKFRLEVFRTPKKGWGVRPWDPIPSGAPICEYIGLLRRTKDLHSAADNSYVFDIDCLQTMKGLEGRKSRLRDVSLPSYLQKLGEEATETVPFCIDAGKTGNIARFINHSCQPNLFVQCMLSEHHDLKLARVILIAADSIQPLTELTYDYGYALDSVLGPDGKIQRMSCFCGADECRKRLY